MRDADTNSTGRYRQGGIGLSLSCRSPSFHPASPIQLTGGCTRRVTLATHPEQHPISAQQQPLPPPPHPLPPTPTLRPAHFKVSSPCSPEACVTGGRGAKGWRKPQYLKSNRQSNNSGKANVNGSFVFLPLLSPGHNLGRHQHRSIALTGPARHVT